MNLSKVSKKAPYKDSRLTLNAIDTKVIQKFETEYKSLDDKKKLLAQLNRKKQGIRTKYSNEYHDLTKTIKKLEDEIYDIENKTGEMDYLLKAAPHFLEYTVGTEPTESEEINVNGFFIKKGTNRGEICKKYITECIGDGYSLNTKSNELDFSKELTCSTCGIEKVTNPRESTASCTNCGEITKYQDSQNNKGEYSEEVEVLSPFAYKRINHFKEWITSISASEGSGPPDSVIVELLHELKKDRIETREEVTEERIKSYLKNLGYSKLYDNIPVIMYKLCGTEPPKISRELQEQLIKMFEEIQIPFEKYQPESRKNFLSYSYTLYKMFQLLGQTHLLNKLHLLKSREKLYQQDLIWKGICTEKKWVYIASI